MTGAAFVSYLGENTVPIATALGERLSREVGVDLAFDPTASWDERLKAIEADEGTVYWMCGFLTVQAIDDGRLEAEIVAAPVFPGRSSATYRSAIIAGPGSSAVSLEDLAGTRLAVNEVGSWSGYHALRVHLADRGQLDPFFGPIVLTGSHAGSISALLTGAADCAAIDETVWTDRVVTDPELAQTLSVIDHTAEWPAPPFAIARALDRSLRDRIAAGLIGASPPGLVRILPAASADYDPIRRGHERSMRVRW